MKGIAWLAVLSVGLTSAAFAEGLGAVDDGVAHALGPIGGGGGGRGRHGVCGRWLRRR